MSSPKPLGVLGICQLASPRVSNPREQSEATISLWPSLRSQLLIITITLQPWFSVEGDYTKAKIKGGENHWGPSRRSSQLICEFQSFKLSWIKHAVREVWQLSSPSSRAREMLWQLREIQYKKSKSSGTFTQHSKLQSEMSEWSIWLPPPPSETIINPQNPKPSVKFVVLFTYLN